ncbi:MAG: RNA polymerase sigma factor [Salibacteraceae bacterium]
MRKSSERLTDAELIRRFQQTGDEHLIAALMERYAAQIAGLSFRYCSTAEDREDFATELFLKLREKLPALVLDDREDFGSWMTVLVKHSLLDQLRKKQNYDKHKSAYGLEAALFPQAQAEEASPEEAVLMAALAQLPENERLCVEAIYLKEESYQQLMKRHGFSFNQVRGFRDRGIRRLRELLPANRKGLMDATE